MNHSHRSSQPHWEVHGDKGPHLLLLHGFLSSRAQWIPNMDSLSRVARLVVVELLGHGRSPAPELPSAYSPWGYIEAFEKIRKHLKISQWMLCGQSLGAGLTLRYALECPEHVPAQIFTNSTSAFQAIDNPEEAKKNAEIAAEIILKEDRDGIQKLPIHPANARRLRADVKSALVEDSRLISPMGVANTIRYTVPEVSVRREIHKNTIPTLLISGKQEKRFKPSRDFAEANMPQLEIIEFDGGHAINIDAADDFNGAITAFIKKHFAS